MLSPRALAVVLLSLTLSAAGVVTAAPAPAKPPRASVSSGVELSPESGRAGSDVTVRGVGFPSRTSGTVHFATERVATFKTGKWGDVSSSFSVPDGYHGQVPVTVAAGSTSVTVAFSVDTVSDPAPEPTSEPTAEPTSEPAPAPAPLTWQPPSTDGYTVLEISAPGTYNLYANTDYVVSAPARIDGAVHLRGGRNVVWIGGHIRISDQGTGPVHSSARRGLVVSDMDDSSGDPTRFGYSPDGRVVHVEGLLIDGPDLTEGINTNAPKAVVQLQNVRVEKVHFRNSDDRDGTNGWGKNHPDVLQTWGSQKELRIDGLSGTSAYQGVFLKEDASDSVHGPMWLRRVDIQAYEHSGDDGETYAGHRMLTWYGTRMGTLHLDPGTVWVAHHANSGWNRARMNPAPDTGFWRDRFWSTTAATYVQEAPPGDAVFTDALGDTVPTASEDALGTYAVWPSTQVVDWAGSAAGRVYAGTPAGGPYVPSGSVGIDYASPGYQ